MIDDIGPLKALTLVQPWASLVSWGLKRVETRSWQTKYRGPLLIHAGQKWTAGEQDAMSRLRAWPSVRAFPDLWWKGDPTRGAVVAVVWLDSIEVMTPESIAKETAMERAFGDWRPGRFAWRLSIKSLIRFEHAPIKLRGKQSIFDVTPGPRDKVGGVSADDFEQLAQYVDTCRVKYERSVVA